MELAAQVDGTLERHDSMWVYRQAGDCARELPFSIVATAAANGDWIPARLLCAREQDLHGLDWALDLWDAICEAVDEEHAMEPPSR